MMIISWPEDDNGPTKSGHANPYKQSGQICFAKAPEAIFKYYTHIATLISFEATASLSKAPLISKKEHM